MSDDNPLSLEDIRASMDELRRMARALLRKEGRAGSVTTMQLILTALRREKRQGQDWSEVRWENQREFFRHAYQSMRRALIDYARTRNRRPTIPAGGLGSEETSPLLRAGVLNLRDLAAQSAENFEQAEEMDHLLRQLDEAHPAMHLSTIVGHYAFSGLTQQEIADLLGVEVTLVRRRLALAKVTLARIWSKAPATLST